MATDFNYLRNVKPKNIDELDLYLRIFLGIKLSKKALVPGMVAPLQVVWEGFSGDHDRLLYVSARGAGKTMAMAVLMLLNSHFYPQCHTSHIAPIGTQANIAYRTLRKFLRGEIGEPYGDYCNYFTKSIKHYTEFKNGSTVVINTATDNGVRGEHVQRLFLDEVDNLEQEVYESCIGMVKATDFIPAQILGMSTWNSNYGRVSDFLSNWQSRDVMFSTWLETAKLCKENCSECKGIYTSDKKYTLWESCHGPIQDGIPYGRCHERHPSGGADGHVSRSELILKFTCSSYERWLSEYESQAPRASGKLFTWFLPNLPQYNEHLIYNPNLPLISGLDYGASHDPTVMIFGQYDNGKWNILDGFEIARVSSQQAIEAIGVYSHKRFGKLPDKVYRDPSAAHIYYTIDSLWPDVEQSYPGGKFKNDKKFRLDEAIGIPGVTNNLFIDKTSHLDELRNEMASIKLEGQTLKMPGRSPDYLDALSYLMAGELYSAIY